MWRTIRARIFVASAIAALLTIVLIGAFTAVTMARQAMMRTAHILQRDAAHSIEECLADPTTFGRTHESGRQVMFAYDLETGLSANPNAPPSRSELFDKLRGGEDATGELRLFQERGGYIAGRLGPKGPCSAFQGHFTGAQRFRKATLLGMLLIAVLGIGAAMAFVVFLALRPTMTRIGRLRTAAQSIGSPEAYQRAADDTPDELGELGKSIDDAHERILADTDALAAHSRAIENHQHAVAHDLRTPISALQLTLQRAASTDDETERQTLLNEAMGELVYVDGLTENLRLQTRLKHQPFTPETLTKYDLGEMLQRIATRTEVLARLQGTAINCALPERPILVRCEPIEAQQAFGNVVHNAMQYAASDVVIVLDQVGDRFQIQIIDDGPGVDPDELANLTDWAFRSNVARQRHRVGSGLGLAITRQVCERAGWTLEISNAEDGGLCVEISGKLA